MARCHEAPIIVSKPQLNMFSLRALFFHVLRNDAEWCRMRVMKEKKNIRRRRVLMLADFSYASAKAIASGVIRFVSARPDLELLLGGTHPQNNDLEYEGNLVTDGIISCMGTRGPLLKMALNQVHQQQRCLKKHYPR